LSPEFEIVDYERFRQSIVANARIEVLHTGMRWPEGPVWFADSECLLWSDIPNNRIMRWVEGAPATVYRYPSNNANGNTRELSIATSELVKPNGLAFSPDESILYIADSGVSHDPNGPHHIVAFDVVDGVRLVRPRVFATISPGVADGFRVDTEGNVWTTAGDGVHCYAPDGALLGKIHLPEVATNLTFGGPKRNRLFVTTASSLIAVYVGQRGAQWP
jgi:gluconolactonase